MSTTVQKFLGRLGVLVVLLGPLTMGLEPAFAQPALGSFGNSGRSILRGPGINNLDLGFFKNFFLPKDAVLQFRVEAFNALNHPQWSGVSQNITSANFGVVTSARPGRIVQLGAKILW